jgi:hypothetical protein
MGLRTVLECYVTLAYLMKKNDEALWRSFRVYGAGQGKLAFLKIDESEELSEHPVYVSVDILLTRPFVHHCRAELKLSSPFHPHSW